MIPGRMSLKNSKITLLDKREKQVKQIRQAKNSRKSNIFSLQEDAQDDNMDIADQFTEHESSNNTSKAISRVAVFANINKNEKAIGTASGTSQRANTTKFMKTGRSDVFVPLTAKTKNQTIKQQIYSSTPKANNSFSKKKPDNSSSFADNLIQRCLFQSDDKNINKSFKKLSNPPKPGKRVNSPLFAYEQLFSMHTPKDKSKLKKISTSQDKSHLYQSKNRQGSGCKRCNEKSQPKVQVKSKNKQNKSPKRTLDRFLEDQAQHTANREARLTQKRKQIQKVQQEQYTHRPLIDKNSNRIFQSKVRVQSGMVNSSVQLKSKKPVEVYQRLSVISKEKPSYRKNDEQYLFSPKILSRSKQMNRTSKVCQLLYNDAVRRNQKQRFMRQSMSSRVSITPNINKNASKLVLRKMRTQFEQLLQGMVEDGEDCIPAILAISILGQLFNIDLNPTRGEQKQDLCQKVLRYLVNQSSTQESDYRSDEAQLNDEASDQTNIDINKLWRFIEVLVSYNDNPSERFAGRSRMGPQGQTFFTKQEQEQIYNHFSDFYSNRVAKERKPKTPQRLSFQPQTLQRSKRLALKHRQRMLTQVNQFVQSQNAVKLSNFRFAGSALKNSVEPPKDQINSSAFQSDAKTNDEKSIKIEDLFIAEYMKRKTQNENRKRQYEEQRVAQCTFKPKTNQNYKKDNARKLNIKIVNRIKSKENVNGQQSNQGTILKEIRVQENRKIVPLSAKNLAIKLNSIKDNQNQSKAEVKNLEKTILRMSQGRKERQLSNSSKLRSYPDPRQVQNYDQYQRKQKTDLINSSKRLKGYVD